jgi:hypothetical protein
MLERYLWLVYVALAGLSWGTYVPLIFYGGTELGSKSEGRFMAILCVGVAYFLIGVLFPLYLFVSGRYALPPMRATGLVFSGLAGAAGAIGAICVIFASMYAVSAAKESGLNPAAYRLYIAPLIFGLAPVINTIVSALWHPGPGEPFRFSLELPGWKLWVGIVLVGVGAALVLFSKEEAESSKHATVRSPVAVTTADPPREAAQ